MALTFRQVRHFIATAETEGVSAAAAGLNVAQSAVTASIKALERTRLSSVQQLRPDHAVVRASERSGLRQRRRAGGEGAIEAPAIAVHLI
jgi:Bacterial regulatory helix-turn-helix protein, lysR family